MTFKKFFLSISLLKKYVDIESTCVHADVGEIITIYDINVPAEDILKKMEPKDQEYLILLDWVVEDGAFVYRQFVRTPK